MRKQQYGFRVRSDADRPCVGRGVVEEVASCIGLAVCVPDRAFSCYAVVRRSISLQSARAGIPMLGINKTTGRFPIPPVVFPYSMVVYSSSCQFPSVPSSVWGLPVSR